MSLIHPSDPTASGAPVAPVIAPGWYPDGSGAQRWWDGRGWTEHVAASPATNGAVGPAVRPQLPAGSRIDTVWVWLVAVVLFVGGLPIFFFDIGDYLTVAVDNDFSGAGAGFIITYLLMLVGSWGAYGLTVFFAFRDHKHLGRIGVVRPFHWAFAFLGSIVYLIGRFVVLRKVSRTAGAPLWVFIGLWLLYVIASIVWITVAFGALFSSLPTLDPGDYTGY